MADVKFTGLPASSGIPNDGSLLAMSTYDGVSAYVSEKYTITQAKAIFGNAPASTDNAIVRFDSTGGQVQNGTTTLSDAGIMTMPSAGEIRNGTASILFSGSLVGISSDNGALAEGWLEIDSVTSALAWGSSSEVAVSDGIVDLRTTSGSKIKVNTTGVGFFNVAPVAKQTSVAVSAAGIHAALVNYGLIT